MTPNTSAELLKAPCPACRAEGKDGTGDNLVVYPEGRGSHCFACGYHEHGDAQRATKPKTSEKLDNPLRGSFNSLKSRKIDEKTCRLYDYQLAKFQCGPNSKRAQWNGTVIHIANYWRDGELVAQHARFNKPKSFSWRGDASNLPLFGQHLWAGRGKRIVVTEGEIDCLTISQLWRNRWPVVSIASGASGAADNVRNNLDFLSGYDEIVIAFDSDEAGRKAAKEVADILPPGKVKIATFPMKDPNAMHLRGQDEAILQCIYEARSYQPDGILAAGDIKRGGEKKQRMWTWPWDCLTKSLMGMRSGEMTLIASGTGSGKSTWCRELGYHHLLRGRRVGLVMLEENPLETMDDLIALHLKKPVRQIHASRELNEIMVAEGKDPLEFGYIDNLTEDEVADAHRFLAESGNLFVYDHGGMQQYGNILQRIEYLAAGLQCDLIFVDHVTAVASDLAENGYERQALDTIMKTFRSIVERTGAHIVVISQLNRLDGKAAEEGGQISLKNLRGSGGLGFWPNNILAIERDQQAEDTEERKIVRVRALKGRFTGDTGIAGMLKFNTKTRRLEEVEWTPPPTTGDDDAPGSTLETDELSPEVSAAVGEVC